MFCWYTNAEIALSHVWTVGITAGLAFDLERFLCFLSTACVLCSLSAQVYVALSQHDEATTSSCRCFRRISAKLQAASLLRAAHIFDWSFLLLTRYLLTMYLHRAIFARHGHDGSTLPHPALILIESIVLPSVSVYLSAVLHTMRHEPTRQVIMATNRADTLDPALLRPGRLDRKIEFPVPDRRQKRMVFTACTAKMNLSEVRSVRGMLRSVGYFGWLVRWVCFSRTMS